MSKTTYTATITPEAAEAMRRQAAERVEVTVDAQTLIALRGLVARFDSEDLSRQYLPNTSGDINAVRVLVDRLEDAFARKEQP